MSELSPLGKKNSRRTWLYGLTGFMLALVLGGGFVIYQVTNFLYAPGSSPSRDVEIAIHPGTQFSVLARDLQKDGIIRDARKFTMYARWTEQSDKIKSGRFVVNTGWQPSQVLDHLINGMPLLDKVTIPEGLPWWETAKILEKAGLVRFDDFKAAIFDPEFLRHWGIPFANAEGFLFPDTYLIMRPLELNVASAKGVAGRLIDTFWRRAETLWPDGKRPSGNKTSTIRDIVIMGSIIEKETSLPEERARVSGVYANRITTGMLLQADPTVIYGIGLEFKGQLRRSQLDDAANKYNTYKNPGLPPGPICSPGLASLQAAIHPEPHKYLYFVARGDGGHTFSSNLAEHNQAVRLYREMNP